MGGKQTIKVLGVGQLGKYTTDQQVTGEILVDGSSRVISL